MDRCDEGRLQAARQRLCRISAKALSKSLSRRALAKRWRLGCGSPCTGIHTRTNAATNVLGDERVITKIRFLREKGVPLYPKYVLKHYAALFSAALRIFGSWANALIAAGIEVPDAVHDGRRGVLRALRDALEQHSENDLSEKLKLHAVYYFGSLQKAKAALKTDRRLRTGWSTTKIIAAISERQRLGKPLGYAAARRDDPALVSAAEAYFGSWGNALHAAGIDPNLYLRRKWRKRRMTAKRDHLSYGNLFSSPCPQCNGYLGIVLREPGRNMPVQSCQRALPQMRLSPGLDRHQREAAAASSHSGDDMLDPQKTLEREALLKRHRELQAEIAQHERNMREGEARLPIEEQLSLKLRRFIEANIPELAGKVRVKVSR